MSRYISFICDYDTVFTILTYFSQQDLSLNSCVSCPNDKLFVIMTKPTSSPPVTLENWNLDWNNHVSHIQT